MSTQLRRWCFSMLPLALVFVSPATAQEVNRNIRFGMPTKATSDPKNRDDFLIERKQYVLSYSDKKKTPNWVSWNLVASDIAKADRGGFEPDPLLPDGFPRVNTDVYTKTGFDRGHMCNSHDRSDSEENNDPTFFLTNIVPQAPNNNHGPWERLEAYCQSLAK